MKTKIILSIFLFSLAGFFIAGVPAKAASCSSVADCSTGEWCNLSNTCQTIVAGVPCSSTSFCQAGNPALTCGKDSSGKSVCVAATGATSGSNQNQTSNTNNSSASASTGDCGGDVNLVNVKGLCLPKNQFNSGIANSQSLSDFLLQLTQLLLDVVGAIGVLVLVVGGFWYITSAGNEEQAEKGKTAIINAIIGIVVVALSYAIVTIISSTLTQANK